MKLTPIAFIIAAGIFGYALAYSPPAEPIVTDPTQSDAYKAKVAECDSLSFSLTQALEAKGLAESKVKELQEKLAASTEVKPETGIVTTLPVGGAACPTGNCQPAYQPATVEYYTPRRRLFSGRIFGR